VIAFRWAVGVFAALMAAGSVLGLVIGVAVENRIWMARARRFRHWLWLAALLWFNVEVWGRVVWTLIHWNS
jgi:hypothetical protein